jgi:probable HAF family extracellular repeat protein
LKALTSAWVLSLLATVAWSQSITWLGVLPGGDYSVASGVSADGSVVVGWSYSNAARRDRAFRWTVDGGMQDLGTLGGGASAAHGVSADGAVVVGWSYNAAGQLRAFRWTENDGMQNLGTLPGGDESVAWGVSANGAVVVGWTYYYVGDSEVGYYERAFRWTENDGMQNLGTLGGGYYSYSLAYDVSADGAVVVGFSDGRPFRWTAAGGMEDLNLTYASLLTDGSVLLEARAISPDGRYIVGVGYNAATGRGEAFLLDTVPEPASLMALGAGLVGLLLRRRSKQ